MNISNNKKKFYKDLLYKALIFIGTVGIIVYFLPREGKFNYQFDINKPWKYGLLQASFDFPIFKDENVVKKVQDSILSLYQPYYQLDNNIGKLEINKLRENYNKDLRKTLPSVEYMKYIEKALKKIYETGIVSNEEMNRLSKDSIRSIMVVNKNMATPLAVNNLFTIKGAYEYIMNADTIHFNRNMLHLYNLN